MSASTTHPFLMNNRDAYRAAVIGDYENLREFFMRQPMSPINESGDTVLHVLAFNRHKDAVCKLLELPLPDHGLMTQNVKGNTALHEAIRVGSVEIAKEMVKKDARPVTTRNLLGETPLFWAAAFGQKEIFCSLYKLEGSENGLRSNDSTILHAAVSGGFYSLAQVIIELYPELALTRNQNGLTALHLLAQSPSSFKSGTIYAPINLGLTSDYKSVLKVSSGDVEDQHDDTTQKDVPRRSGLKRLVRWYPCIRKIDDEKQKNICAEKLTENLIRLHSAQEEYDQNGIKKALMLATKHGITEVVERILEEFPEAINWRDDPEDKNLLHLVAEYRRYEVFHFLTSKKFPLKIMVADVDRDGNTPLHLAANFGEHQPMHVIGPQQQMSWELLWFKVRRVSSKERLEIPDLQLININRVERISLPHLLHLQNSNGKTAKELFKETHGNLRMDAEKWIREMSYALMLISTLIATINFTAVFTVPGGYKSDSGLPVLLGERRFFLFMEFLSVALFFSLLTLGFSVSANLSRFHQDEFYIAIPFKFLLIGNSLFFSVIFTVMAYGTTLYMETTGQFTVAEHTIGAFGKFTGLSLTFFIYIDIMYPYFRRSIMSLFHSLTDPSHSC